MNELVLKQYIDTYFSERPVEELSWKYSLWDMLDEWLLELALIGLFALIYYFGVTYEVWFKYFAYIGWLLSVLYAFYLLGVVFLRRICMKFHLTQDHFEYSYGLFSQKMETFQLSDIIEIDLQRSLWERLIHTGTIIIRFKSGTDSHTNPLIIRGIGKYNEMFQKIDYYRNHHRLVLYFGI